MNRLIKGDLYKKCFSYISVTATRNLCHSSEDTGAAETNILKDESIFSDFKSGPLSEYRKKSSFCYRRMIVALEGEEHIRLKVSSILGYDVLIN